jgi:hypothetical protein
MAAALRSEALVVKVQGLYRRRRAIRMVRDLVRSVYEYVEDPKSQAAFYYNTMNGQSSWTKPRILGQEEVRAPPLRRACEWRLTDLRQQPAVAAP